MTLNAWTFAASFATAFFFGGAFGAWLYPKWLAWALTDSRLARRYFLQFRTLPMIHHLINTGPTCPTCGWVVHKSEEFHETRREPLGGSQ